MLFLEILVSILYVAYAAAHTFSLYIVYDNATTKATSFSGGKTPLFTLRNAASITAAALSIHLSLLVLGATAPPSVVEEVADLFGGYAIRGPYTGLSDAVTTMAMFADAAQLYVAIDLASHMFYRHGKHNSDNYLKRALIAAASVGLVSSLFCGAKDGEEFVWALQALMLAPAAFFLLQMGAHAEKVS
jgi:hypothetical protein